MQDARQYNHELATKVRYRQSWRLRVLRMSICTEGTNSRLDVLAVILDVKIKHLSAWTKKGFQMPVVYKHNLNDVKSVFIT